MNEMTSLGMKGEVEQTASRAGRAITRLARAEQAAAVMGCLAALAAGTGCSRTFMESCSETRSCPGSLGGEGGDDGSGGRGGGSTESSGGSAGESGGEASDGCESRGAGVLGAPSPYLPMAGAYTGAVRSERSLKPRFAWHAPKSGGSCDEFTYEIELSRECVPGKLQECAFKDVEVREAGLEATEWTPEGPLPVSEVAPVGALYAWRVRACEAPNRCSAWSRVSYVNVGRLIDDIDADGYSDLVELGGGALAWFSAGDARAPLASVSVVPESVIGSPLTPDRGRFLGDVNGDGFPDLLLWSTTDISVSHPPVLILGASTVSAWTGIPVPQQSLAYSRSARVGDLDADGFADVALVELDGASTSTEQQPSVLRLYRGKADFTWSSPSTLPAPGGPSRAFGAALVGGLDSNGDGYSDLFVLDDSRGALHLAYGGRSLPVRISASVESGDLVTVGKQESDLMDLGDHDGDGFSDVAAFVTNIDTYFENSTIKIFRGGPEFSRVPAAHLVVSARYGVEWFGGYDLGADGRADLLMTTLHDDTYGYYTGQFRALVGSQNEQSEADLVEVSDLGPTLTKAGLSGGDYDGDGAIDLTIRVNETERRVLRGGRPAEARATCSPTPTTSPRIFDWCSVESTTFTTPSKYTNPNKTVR
jgi:hypothetical protein